MTTAAPAKRPPRPVANTRPPSIREMSAAMGCKPGCACKCNRALCACREARVIPSEPSAADRANGARVTIRKAAR